jgi:hypothetical protein
VWVWRAWQALKHERGYTIHGVAASFGGVEIHSVPGCIPWTAIIRYAEWHDYGREQTSFLLRLLAELDQVFLAWWSERKGAS